MKKKYDLSEWHESNTPLIDRVYGALWLSQKIQKASLESQFKVPAFYIVVPRLENVEIELRDRDLHWIMTYLQEGAGKIYFKKIKGQSIAGLLSKEHVKVIKEQIGYSDFGDNDNIIFQANDGGNLEYKGEKGSVYMVDTEPKGLVQQECNKELAPSYIEQRWQVLNKQNLPLRKVYKSNIHVQKGTGTLVKGSYCDYAKPITVDLITALESGVEEEKLQDIIIRNPECVKIKDMFGSKVSEVAHANGYSKELVKFIQQHE